MKRLSSRVITGENDSENDKFGLSPIYINAKSPQNSPSKSFKLRPSSPLPVSAPKDEKDTDDDDDDDFYEGLDDLGEYQSQRTDKIENSKINIYGSIHRKKPKPTIVDQAFTETSSLEIKLTGSSLKLFSAKSQLRLWICNLLMKPWLEPLMFILLILHVAALTYGSVADDYVAQPEADQTERVFRKWGAIWIDWAFLVIFSLYTIEIIFKAIAFGLWDDSQLFYSTGSAPSSGWRRFFPNSTVKKSRMIKRNYVPLMTKTFTRFLDSKKESQPQFIAQRAYLRSSWNRVDFVSTICYWVSLMLSLRTLDTRNEFFFFKFLSGVRILRLLNITHGTSAVLRSLKKAAPLLINVALFIGFFWVLFSIIGVQSFKASFRRQCVWVDPQDTSNTAIYNMQFCGSHLNSTTLEREPFLYKNGESSGIIKGFACPSGSYCISDANPYEGTVSFDNFFNSFELVFVIISSNTYTDLMYYMMDSDYMAASLFFMAGILVLSWWLVNLLVAVIAASFSIIREEMNRNKSSKVSKAFSKMNKEHKQAMVSPQSTKVRSLYKKTSFLGVFLIVLDLIVQSFRTATMSKFKENVINNWAAFTTYVLLFEIIFRFTSYIPQWKHFFFSLMNWIDLILVIITSVSLLPPIRGDPVLYGWLSFFQVARFYRCVISIPYTKATWTRVLGNYRAIFNMSIFFFLLTFLSSLIASDLLRGVISEDVGFITFSNLSETFIGMYIISSTENWTELLYLAVQESQTRLAKVTISAFLIGWFIFSNNIVLNLFVALITENLDVSDNVKRREQIKEFVKEYAQKINNSNGNEGSLKIIRNLVKGKAPEKNSYMENQSGDAIFELLLKKQIVVDFLKEENVSDSHKPQETDKKIILKRYRKSFLKFIGVEKSDNPFFDKNHGFKRFFSKIGSGSENIAEEFINENLYQRQKKEEYLQANPDFNTVLFYFKPNHPLRRFCQKIVPPTHGIRYGGVVPKTYVWYSFSLFMFLSTIALVALACFATPLYQTQYMELHGNTNWNWMVFNDVNFLIIFSLEALLYIFADGFYMTPNAYLRSSWGIIDSVVLITLWINFFATITGNGYVSRAVRGFKALKALKLLNFSEKAKSTFHNVIIAGIGKIFGAAAISLCLLFPFTIWGLNLFNGRMSYCLDPSNWQLSECFDEFRSSPFEWEILSPRSVVKEYYDFDDFAHSFLILFEIISLEGWVDVLDSVMSITGLSTNKRENFNKLNAVFVMLYNFLGMVFIITLFISVIIKNYAKTTGSAFLTTEQKSWREIKKLLKKVKPTVQPTGLRPGSFKERCYNFTVKRNTSWSFFLTILLFVLAILLSVEYYPEPESATRAREGILTLIMFIHEMHYLLKLFGLGAKGFWESKWDVYALVVTTGGLVSTSIGFSSHVSDLYYNFQKLFLVGIVLLLIPRSKRLSLLLKTASISLPSIVDLLITWFVLFIAYAIAFNQIFGLTRIGPSGSNNINFRTVPKALILLFRMSCGEGWNEIMADYLLEPPYCIQGNAFNQTDCGSKPYAYVLFISWNILSMYIFVNMFVSLIYENFSYVYQHEGSAFTHITREEIRIYKNAWVKFDPQGTGYISTDQLYSFLRSLDGVFSMRIYDGLYTIPILLEDSAARLEEDDLYDVDWRSLNKSTRSIPVDGIKKRRRIYEMFCEQALMESHPRKGISFHKLLLQIPLCKSVDEKRCLKLDEYLKRRLVLQKVEEQLLRNKFRGLLLMLEDRRAFLRHLKNKSRNPFDDSNVALTPVPRVYISEAFEEADVSSYSENLNSKRNNRLSDNSHTILKDSHSSRQSQNSSKATSLESNRLGFASKPSAWRISKEALDSRRRSVENSNGVGFSDDADSNEVNLLDNKEEDILESFKNSEWGQTF
ncbi:hypothetical protein NADFUDRAFT_22699 [Nadsonia fulvescens var. elongata DSM 6958]|uniref:Calcium-channel protein CCH1 n=1 Tax=Nadsonia fulvescens var. elongata DSM 6958 TaxID=857566 RepID=A0A1E3PMI6_9ASCO|nr:hypothetical protein NADFUDRAFT_22699 [Nadsonia fulvescens var. elongata DSM 6958]